MDSTELAAGAGLHPVVAGLLAGVTAFSAAYTALPALGVYEPIWRYDVRTIWKDASAHAIFGAGAGVTLAAANALRSRRS